jgi:hypothetical protein
MARIRGGLIVILLAAAIAGCAGGTLTAGAPAPAAAPQPPGVADQAAAPAGTPRAEPLVSQEVHSDGATVRVDITGLTRQGRLATLTWNITMVRQNAKGWWYPGTRMSDNNVNGYDVSAVSLVDPVNAKRYLVARSGGEQGECVCSSTGSSDPLQPGDSVSLFATFTAPPPDVTRVDVELKELGAFSGVPVS